MERQKEKGKRQKVKGKREEGEGKRKKAKGKRKKAKGKREKLYVRSKKRGAGYGRENKRSDGCQRGSGHSCSDLLIIGGGAAGMCSAFAARKMARSQGIGDEQFVITILERNSSVGAKIRISGGGRCNITHAGPVKDLLQKGFQRKVEQRFLRHALHAFSNEDVRAMLATCGVETAARDDGKVFPVSRNAGDVLEAFQSMLRNARVYLVTGERVTRAERLEEGFRVASEGREHTCRFLVLATGGVSYRHTGTTGDGLDIAVSLGHSVVKPSPALAPIYLKPPPPPELVGVSLRGTGLRVQCSGTAVSRNGDVLITHKGVSGPACLSLSVDAALLLNSHGKGELTLDFFPDHSSEDVAVLLLRHAEAHGSQFIRKYLQAQQAIPSAMVPYVMLQAGIDRQEKWGSLTKKARRSLQRTLKDFSLGWLKSIPLDAGEVSAGGVALQEIHPGTMESRVCSDLFLCGELLDYTGEVGGFNLQAAFSTGWLAGSSIRYPVQA